MDSVVLSGIIAFATAIIATAIGGVINYIIETVRNKRTRREEVLRGLYLLKTKLSLHKIDMHSGSESVSSFNENYDSANILIADIKMSLSLYFKSHVIDFEPVVEEAAYYWKMYKDHLISVSRDYDGENSPFQRALHASMNCTDIIEKMMSELSV
ncbi:hypothetical protein R50072_01270 [Simiduia litorea]|uniref:hypothetical protein n=1 Tax=Simiduia litorea TaxID=1435348 RepID=UPI0036F3FF2E